MKNKTMYFRTMKNEEQPFVRFDAQLWNLPNDEMLIMLAILSNTDDWILNAIEIQNRLQKGGMGKYRFQKAMNNLQMKGYLVKDHIQGGYLWKVYENPSNTFKTTPKTNIQRAPKPKVENYKKNQETINKEWEEYKRSDRYKKIYGDGDHH